MFRALRYVTRNHVDQLDEPVDDTGDDDDVDADFDDEDLDDDVDDNDDEGAEDQP